MKSARFTIAVTIALAAIALTNCTKTEYVTNEQPSDAAHVQGTVYLWRCGIGDFWNNPTDPAQRRLSIHAGETAQITFIRDNGFTTLVETNDTASFDLYLSPGSFNVAVATGFNYPADTFYNIHLSHGDTTLSLDLGYDVLDASYVTFGLVYPRIFDTLSTQAEWNIITTLNDRTVAMGNGFPALDLRNVGSPADVRRITLGSYLHVYYVEYRLPVYREYWGRKPIYNIFEARDLLQNAIDADTTGLIPTQFNFGITIAEANMVPCLQ